MSGNFFQARDVHGPVTMQQRAASADELLAENLAEAVREQSRKEEDQWRIGDPAPLSVRWHPAEQDLFDSWENIQDKVKPERTKPVSLSGQFTTIRETFQATGSQRLLVLGRAGAGKTVLAHRLILDLLDHRSHRGPVPVWFSLNDWNPTTTGLRDWMANRLVRDHPFLEQHDTTGKRKAELLVDRDWILPVLDGFDELPAQHHRAAISEISRAQWPLMVTSRPIEYARAARTIKAVGRAAAIELEDLTLEQAEQYLRRSTKPSRAAEWEAVFEHLRTAPEDTASQNLAAVMTTPLMVMLARTLYNDTNTRSPDELLDTTRFPNGEDFERHLLGGYVDTVYSPSHNTPSGNALPVWDPEHARHWLSFLATRLQAHGTHDFAWWQLPALLSRRTRILATTATICLTFGLPYGLPRFLRTMDKPQLVEELSNDLVFGIVLGIALGLTFGILNEANFARGRAGPKLERLRLHWRRHGRQWRHSKRAHLTKATSEFTNGVALGLTLGCMSAGIGFVSGLTFGLIFGVVVGGLNAVVSVFGEGLDPHDSDPWKLLSNDRAVTLTRTIPAGLIIAFFSNYILYRGVPIGVPARVANGLMYASIIVFLRVALSAWGNWLLFARLWLPVTGRLPWRPKHFLEDAYDRGILRRAGAAYQFRHAQLRDHLAENHHKPRKTHPPDSTAPSK